MAMLLAMNNQCQRAIKESYLKIHAQYVAETFIKTTNPNSTIASA